MSKFLTLACALALVTSVSYSQEASRTERTETRTNADGSTTQKKTVTVSSYVDNMRKVYTSVGIPSDKIERLIDLDRKIFEARLAGNWVLVKQYYDQQVVLIDPPLLEKVRVYVREHPVMISGTPIVTTWETAPVADGPNVSLRIDGSSSISSSTSGGSLNVNRTASTTDRSGTNRSSTEVGGSSPGMATGGTNASGSVSGSSSTTNPSATGTGSSSSSTDSSMGTGSSSTGTGSTGATGTGTTGASSTGTGSTGSTGASGSTGSTGASGSTGSTGSSSGTGSTGSSSGSSSSSNQ